MLIFWSYLVTTFSYYFFIDLFGRGEINTSRRQANMRMATFHSNLSDIDSATFDPNHIPASHPLLMRSSDRLPRDNNLAVRNAWSRPERSTRLSRFNQNSFFSDAHVGFSGQSTSSYGVLQRLLDHAQAAATEALNLRAALLHDRSNLRHTEFIFDSGGFHVLSPDNVMDELQGGNQFTNTLHRWKEECGILDSGSVFDCILNAREVLTPVLVKYRNENIAETASTSQNDGSKKDEEHPDDKKDVESNPANIEDMDVTPTPEIIQARISEPEEMDTSESTERVSPTGNASVTEDTTPMPEQNIAQVASLAAALESEVSGSHSSSRVEPVMEHNNDNVQPQMVSTEGRLIWALSENIATDMSTSGATSHEVEGASGTEEAAGTSSETRAEISVEGISIPEGIDPTFLSAIPENMREEVIRDHIQRNNRQQQPATVSIESVSSFNPEFLAALPPEIQEEVKLYCNFSIFNVYLAKNSYYFIFRFFCKKVDCALRITRHPQLYQSNRLIQHLLCEI